MRDCIGQETGQRQSLRGPPPTKDPQRKKSREWTNSRRMHGHRMRVSGREWPPALVDMKKPDWRKIEVVSGN